MIGVLATRNNVRVKNARQPFKRKDIFYMFRSGTQANKQTKAHTK